MLPYGIVKTKHRGKNSAHRDCPICDPDTGNKARARRDGKHEAENQLNEIILFDGCGAFHIDNIYMRKL